LVGGGGLEPPTPKLAEIPEQFKEQNQSSSVESVEDFRESMYQVPIIAKEIIGILNRSPYSGTHNDTPVKTHIERTDITLALIGILPVSR
jgi:hypothetical protein